MTILGISAGFHDAAVTMVNRHGEILFAGHSERYSKQKNDIHLCEDLLLNALEYGDPDQLAYYERPWIKKTRQWFAGQKADAYDMSNITLARYLESRDLGHIFRPMIGTSYFNHHLSHAAAGFQTSRFTRATVVVIDAIGEWDTISIYGAEYDCFGKAKYTRLWNKWYPNSIGLFYSAVTKHVGLRPMDEEYILMGMAAYGKNTYDDAFYDYVTRNGNILDLAHNFHIGLDSEAVSKINDFDLAHSAQSVAEKLIMEVMRRATGFKWSNNLVYCGGVALNCSANRLLGEYFDDIWIMPNPGDAGSSLGAAALAHRKRLSWQHPYLGYDIKGPYPVDGIIRQLETNNIVGVASGRAEFGPRALGNRSLLADPRGPEVKDKVNGIKRRQKFRPFAPVILEEFVHQYFDMPVGWKSSPYMQVTAHCKRPEDFPAIIHADGTSRVQTVSKDCGSGIRLLLKVWYEMTGCPMLLNTSLNIRGEPMVNDRSDADRFEREYGVKVLS